MSKLQDTIHNLETGRGAQAIKATAIVAGLVLLFLGYNWRAYRNFATQEAMDSAQLAMNLSESKGFSTMFIRPLSIYLLTNHAGISIAAPGNRADDVGWLKGNHPDLANPPVYPLVLAGLFKILPVSHQVSGAFPDRDTKNRFWDKDGRFWWYPPDFCVAVFNQLLLVVIMVMSYLLAKRLFDVKVAWLTVLAVLGSELLWRYSVSGLSTMLLIIVFLALVWVLVNLEAGIRTATLTPPKAMILCILAGVLVGLGMLTRYSFGLLVLPLIGFVILYSGPRRAVHAIAVLLVFLAVIAPWLMRNYSLSGFPMGTATFDVMKATPVFAENRLERSLAPELRRFDLPTLGRKMLNNGRQVVSTDLPKLGGTWIAAFFLVGLLLQFNNPGINRMKYFVLICVVVLGIGQTAFRTHLSDDSPDVNTENLLVLLTPMVTLFGTAMFVVLRDQMRLPAREFRLVLTGLFFAVVYLPIGLAFFGPRGNAIAYPPYYPPTIQRSASWFKDTDLMMSDVPWAVAWYGRRPCLWLTSDAEAEFYAIHINLKEINGLYLTPKTTDAKYVSNFRWGQDKSWGVFTMSMLSRGELPKGFPLSHAPSQEQFPIMPEMILLADKERWNRPGSPTP